jgi:hypothetical protein
MYIKINDGVPVAYSIEQLRADNPNTSFPFEMSSALLAEFGVFPLVPTDPPPFDFSKILKEGVPQFVEGQWEQTWVEEDAPYEEHLQRVLEARAAEYPPITDYLDGVVKGDQEQIAQYIEACLAVKTKYPKPQQGGV